MQGATAIKMKFIGGAADEWPMINDLWEFYSKKGIKTVFLSIGNTRAAGPDLEIAETLGCPIHVIQEGEDAAASWEEVKQILKSRKREETASSFSEGADTKWVLPKNIRYVTGIPSFGTFPELVKKVITPMNLAEERIDILKLSLDKGAEKAFLYALLDSPYRPGLLLVKWSSLPDSDLSTTLCAGHLQNCGYTLMAIKDDKFIYFYNDRCIYEICSWETNKVDNPMISELVKAINAGNNL
jgi:hypothetical protein